MAEGETAVRPEAPWEDVRLDSDGLCPVVVQDVADGAVLMVAWADRQAIRRTVQERRAWFWSRSRGRPWRKGETSGHALDVEEVRWDCDADTLLYRVRARGPACHTGQRSCFYRGEGDLAVAPAPPAPTEPAAASSLGVTLDALAVTVAERARDLPAGSYTAALLGAGPQRALQKLGEEAVEAVIAGLDPKGGQVVAEFADLFFHALVAMAAVGVAPAAVAAELGGRARRPARTREGDGPVDGIR